jgi:hypothetical protein
LHGLQGDRTGALDSAAAALLLQQWLQEGPEATLIGTAGEGPNGAAHGAAKAEILGNDAVAKQSTLRHFEEI